MPKFANPLGIAVLAATFLLLPSCASIQGDDGTKIKISVSDKSEGYALLYDLVSKEKNVSKLLLIKRDTPQLKAVVKKIAAASKQATAELEKLAKSGEPLNLKITHLPRIEQKSRELIDAETGKALLHAKDVQFEFMLLNSQAEGMNYAAYLAKALAGVETNPVRQEFLRRTEKTFSQLHDEVYQMILNRYAR
jgi:hypothetical protein